MSVRQGLIGALPLVLALAGFSSPVTALADVLHDAPPVVGGSHAPVDVGVPTGLIIAPLDGVIGHGPCPVVVLVDRSNSRSLTMMKTLIAMAENDPRLTLVIKELPSSQASIPLARDDVAARLSDKSGENWIFYEMGHKAKDKPSQSQDLELAELNHISIKDFNVWRNSGAVDAYLRSNTNFAHSIGVASAPVTLVGVKVLIGQTSVDALTRIVNAAAANSVATDTQRKHKQ